MSNHGLVQQRLQKISSARGNPLEIIQHLEGQSARELNELLPALFSTGYAGEEQQALRDAAQAVLQRKLTDALVGSLSTLDQSIKALDLSTTRLTKVGWWLTIVVGIVGIIVSLVVAFAGGP